jgi:hypothetical protein
MERAASAYENQDKGRSVRQPFDAAFDGEQVAFGDEEKTSIVV